MTADRPGQPARGVGGDQGGEGPRLGVLPLDRALQLRRRALPPPADPRPLRRPRGRRSATGRCCDVCDPDPLEQALRARHHALARATIRDGRGRQRRHSRSASHREIDEREPVDEEQFERLRAWRWSRAEGKPAYTVAANAVLEEVLRSRPAQPRGADRDPRHRAGLLREARRVAAGRAGGASINTRADVAQLVEHFTRNEGVRGSSPRVGLGELPAASSHRALDILRS